MEGLVVFGIVCNVIQVVDFGLKTISKGREIAKKGATADILDAGFIAQHLDDLGDALSKSIPTPVANQQLSRSDQQLVDIATKCRDLAKDLSLEVAKLKPAQVAKKWKTFVRLVETLWKTSKIEQMKTRLEAHRRTLDTVLLAKLRYAVESYFGIRIILSIVTADSSTLLHSHTKRNSLNWIQIFR